MEAKGLYFDSQGGVKLQNQSLPKQGEREALIKVKRSGVCNTDLELTKGYMGFSGFLGHEFVGEVLQLPSKCNTNSLGVEVKIGQRVVGEINLACTKCENCQLGGVAKRNHCQQRTVLGILNKNGVHASHVTLPVENLFPVPDNVSDIEATFAEPLAAAFRIVEQGLIKPSDAVAVIGDGKLGLLIAEALNLQPKKSLSIFGHHSDKMALLPDSIEKYISDDKTKKQYESKFDVVVEASGSPHGLMMAANIVKPLGVIVLKTTCAAGTSEFNTAPFVIKEVTVVGSRCGNFKMALEALEKKQIDVKKYLTKSYPLKEALKAFDHAARKGTLKIQIVEDDA